MSAVLLTLLLGTPLTHSQILPTSPIRPIIPRVDSPNEVEATIVSEDTLHNIKRSLDIRLNRAVSEETLRQLALELKAQGGKSYTRTFIAYYLPGMLIDQGAWATTHFDPSLEVKILGMTVEEMDNILSKPIPVEWKLVGQWLNLNHIVTIFRDQNRIIMDSTYSDGSSGQTEVVEDKSRLWRFDPLESSDWGEYWILGPRGTLELHDNQGLISVMPSVP